MRNKLRGPNRIVSLMTLICLLTSNCARKSENAVQVQTSADLKKLLECFINVLPKAIVISDSIETFHKTKVNISDLWSSDNRVCLWYSEHHNQNSVDAATERLMIFCQNNTDIKPVILASYDNPRLLRAKVKSRGNPNETFLVAKESIDSSFRHSETPIFFVITKSGECKYSYFYFPEYEEINNAYFRLLASELEDSAESPTLLRQKPTKIILSPDSIYAGELNLNQSAQSTLRLQNVGTSPLSIYSVSTTCSCTATEWTEKAIPPNNTTAIKIRYTAVKRGNFTHIVIVSSNAEGSPHSIPISGHVK